jgi:CRISPR-associated endonuclease/helicase Cas3
VILAQGGERDDLDLHEEVQSIPWASENTRRFLAAGVAVGTVDQALLSVLRVRHAHLRGAALMRSLLVIDEVHASDPYMAELIATLVQRHLGLGGHVVCLSATLGSSALSLLIGQPAEAFEQARARAYPMISTMSSRLDIKHDPGRERAVITSIASRTVAMKRAATAATDGARVLRIRSAVDDAIADHRELVREGATTLHAEGKPVPHHGRFAPADRPVLDAAILKALGPRQERTRGLVVVATQTAEQSLDIDADLLVSDACPPDVLLQRLGRLQRHALARPTGYERPELVLLDPGPLERFLGGDKRLPHGEPGQRWPWVYPNLLAVNETLSWVAAGTLKLPQDCRSMVEAGTHTDHLRDRAAQLGSQWVALWTALYGREGALRTEARQVQLDWFKAALSQPILSEQVVRSRLGADKVTLLTEFISPLQRHVEQLHVPAHWWTGPLPDKAEIFAHDDDGVMLQAGSLNMRYSSVGLERVI